MKGYNMKQLTNRLLFLVCVLASMNIAVMHSATAAERSTNPGSTLGIESLSVPLYKSLLVSLNSPIDKISIGNPDIADISLRSHKAHGGHVQCQGKQDGESNGAEHEQSKLKSCIQK